MSLSLFPSRPRPTDLRLTAVPTPQLTTTPALSRGIDWARRRAWSRAREAVLAQTSSSHVPFGYCTCLDNVLCMVGYWLGLLPFLPFVCETRFRPFPVAENQVISYVRTRLIRSIKKRTCSRNILLYDSLICPARRVWEGRSRITIHSAFVIPM